MRSLMLGYAYAGDLMDKFVIVDGEVSVFLLESWSGYGPARATDFKPNGAHGCNLFVVFPSVQSSIPWEFLKHWLPAHVQTRLVELEG